MRRFLAGLLAALMVLSLCACGVRRSRWAIPAAIAADLTGFLVAAALVRWIWGA